MASNGAPTTYAGLSQWILSDKPGMDDFNVDNQKVDNQLYQMSQALEEVRQQQKEDKEKLARLEAALAGKANTQQYLAEGTNLNNCSSSGLYICRSSAMAATVVNKPVESEGIAFTLNIVAWEGIVIQTLTYYNILTQYTRRCYNGQWSAWKQIAFV